MPSSKGYAALDKQSPLGPFSFTRREPLPTDIAIEVLFCGVCHSDLHMARNEWGQSVYPMVPGHEIVGRVTAAGSAVTKFKVGDIAAAGVIIDSCRKCAPCKGGEEHFCDEGATLTYAVPDRVDGSITMGGYSNNFVVDERFAHTVPANLDLAAVAPLLCAGITTYSPLKHWKTGPGKKVGIIGLGGLGHMGLKFSHAFGAHTVQFTTSASKVEDAKKLGADEVILTKEEGWATKHTGSFDFILDCVSAEHDLTPYLSLLKRDGTLCTVGVPEKPASIHAFAVLGRRNYTGSMIGGIAETQEMLDFCAEHNIVSDIEMTSFDKLDEAWERVIKGDVKYRFVIDTATLPKS
jgi:uncharacterized zinc-type alcohol dehydrogenase-like protein